jgi:hypothetical protein
MSVWQGEALSSSPRTGKKKKIILRMRHQPRREEQRLRSEDQKTAALGHTVLSSDRPSVLCAGGPAPSPSPDPSLPAHCSSASPCAPPVGRPVRWHPGSGGSRRPTALWGRRAHREAAALTCDPAAPGKMAPAAPCPWEGQGRPVTPAAAPPPQGGAPPLPGP